MIKKLHPTRPLTRNAARGGLDNQGLGGQSWWGKTTIGVWQGRDLWSVERSRGGKGVSGHIAELWQPELSSLITNSIWKWLGGQTRAAMIACEDESCRLARNLFSGLVIEISYRVPPSPPGLFRRLLSLAVITACIVTICHYFLYYRLMACLWHKTSTFMINVLLTFCWEVETVRYEQILTFC